MSEISPLQLATSEELFKEIANRCESVLIIIEAKDMKAHSNRVGTSIWFHGGFNAAVGLAHCAQVTLDLMQSQAWVRHQMEPPRG